MSYVGTGPQVAFLKSSPALPDWSLPVPGLRTLMRLTCFPELHPRMRGSGNVSRALRLPTTTNEAKTVPRRGHTSIQWDCACPGLLTPPTLRKGALITNAPARSLSAPRTRGEPHETQGCPHAPWRRGSVVASGGSRPASAQSSAIRLGDGAVGLFEIRFHGSGM